MEENSNLAYPRYLQRKFIELYRANRCLWDHNNDYFKEKMIKDIAINKLVKLVKGHFPNTTKAQVIKKIESMRSCYRREKNKIQTSSAGGGPIYVPNLWYYKHLTFLENSETPKRKLNKKRAATEQQQSDESGSGLEEYLDPQTTFFEALESATTDGSATLIEVEDHEIEEEDPGTKSFYQDNFDDTSDFIVEKKSHRVEVADEYDAIGINVAAKLRGLPPNTRIIAEKLINDVLFKACMKDLTVNSRVT